jgi:HlyD family secretion protein
LKDQLPVKRLLLVLILLGGALAGGAYWLNQSWQLPISHDVFTYAQVKRGAMSDTVSATGTVQPTQTIVVSSLVPGTVTRLRADINDTVHAQQILAELDARQEDLQKKQAEDEVNTARAYLLQAQAVQKAAQMAVDYQRDLNRGGFRAELNKALADLEAGKAGVTVAQAKLQVALTQLDKAKLALDLTRLTVPGSSTASDAATFLVLDRKIRVGRMVGPQSPEPLFLLAGHLQQLEIHTEVVEGDIGKIRPGLPVKFTISSSAEPDLEMQGQVREIRPLPTNDRGAVYYNAVVAVENQKNPKTGEWRLRPGMTASVDVVLTTHADVWKIPMAALNFEMEDPYLTEEARQRLTDWQQRPDWADWRPLWLWQEAEQRVWPVFVRLSNTATGAVGINDGEYHEALEWEPGFTPQPDLPIIISAPPARRPGLLDQPANFKLA